MQIIFDSQGDATCIYDETIELGQLGSLTIRRGSHVEPDAAGRWLADLAPLGGPALGPFLHRSEALLAERHWIDEVWLPMQR